jgi:hypothetical protein
LPELHVPEGVRSTGRPLRDTGRFAVDFARKQADTVPPVFGGCVEKISMILKIKTGLSHVLFFSCWVE